MTAQFMASEKQAKELEERLEAIAEREAAEYLDDCETGDNTEWAQYDDYVSAVALQAIWLALNAKEDPMERVALARDVCRGVMIYAANSHAAQVAANGRRNGEMK